MVKADLKSVGLKSTGPRLKVLDVLRQGTPHHLSAEEIYRRLTLAGDCIGLATVYRVLTQFEQAGLITRHNFESGHSVFEFRAGPHHDHMVCTESGRVIEFVSPEIERLQQEVAASHGYELVDHSLVLFVKPRARK